MSLGEYFEADFKAKEEEHYSKRKADLKANLKELEELMSSNFDNDENMMKELNIKWEVGRKKLEELMSCYFINDDENMTKEFRIKREAERKELEELMSRNFVDENMMAEEKRIADGPGAVKKQKIECTLTA
ncbi:hypothetical protein QJS10_CPB11g00969 [Acorus calamus]|uniref:Uncharacterized protein n=1 Tax=Acorus calamus TaxID=4465 RepID=A0AAV9DUM1_ACOCL|nr:hypothetical protein QJS10_CPB11g00969 [Acorus calamus]